MSKNKSENLLASGRGHSAPTATSTSEKIIKNRKQQVSGNSNIPESENKTKDKELKDYLEKFYSPETFKGLIRAPADIALLFTGDPIWNMPDKEAVALATTASIAARQFGFDQIKWIALAMFAASFSTSYGSRTIAYVNKKRKENVPSNKTE